MTEYIAGGVALVLFLASTLVFFGAAGFAIWRMRQSSSPRVAVRPSPAKPAAATRSPALGTL
jgi:hypothetical protein